MSARAPAGSPKRNIGNIVATCTMTTVRGSASSVAINHPAAALCIHPPMFETTVTVHTTAKAACLNGLSEDVCCLSAALLRSLDSTSAARSSKRDATLTLVALYKSLGGGWQTANAEMSEHSAAQQAR
jgi:hypothetical protein